MSIKALRFAVHARQNGEAKLFEQFRNSVIQTFEYTYREAARAGLLDDPQRWFVFRTIRNKTSHAYDEAYASEAYAAAVDFLPRAKDLLARLQEA